LVRRIDSVLHVDATEAFTRLAQPVLYLRATRDRVVSRRCAELIRKLGPSTRVVDVAGPHLLLQTKPHEAWQQIQAFIEDSLLVRK
jgi:pimeloyl-[acyl-carrier protein] methyl ester esterase